MDSVMFAIGGLGTTELVIIAAVLLLLFGGAKLPQLAKSLGQSKRAFKEGIAEGEEEDRLEKASKDPASLGAVEDEQLFEEARRRARLRVGEGKNN